MLSIEALDAKRIKLEQAMRRSRVSRNAELFTMLSREHANTKRRIAVLNKRRAGIQIFQGIPTRISPTRDDSSTRPRSGAEA